MRARVYLRFLAATATMGIPAAAVAQATGPVASVPVAGTVLSVSATGEVSVVPDVAIISAGVVTKAATATGALSENATRMERVRAALRRAGIADRDIQTSTVSLNPDYRYDQNQPPQLAGYQATNTVSIRFRDIRRSGSVIDALVAEGANQVNGPTLTVDKPDAAMDRARQAAIGTGRARADLYARTLGMRVARLLSVDESGAASPRPLFERRDMTAAAAPVAKTEVDPGEQTITASLTMTFELR